MIKMFFTTCVTWIGWWTKNVVHITCPLTAKELLLKPLVTHFASTMQYEATSIHNRISLVVHGHGHSGLIVSKQSKDKFKYVHVQSNFCAIESSIEYICGCIFCISLFPLSHPPNILFILDICKIRTRFVVISIDSSHLRMDNESREDEKKTKIRTKTTKNWGKNVTKCVW